MVCYVKYYKKWLYYNIKIPKFGHNNDYILNYKKFKLKHGKIINKV